MSSIVSSLPKALALASIEEYSPKIDWLNPESCRTLCDQILNKLQSDVEALEIMRDELMRAQKQGIVQGLCKLNKDVKRQTVKDFNMVFGCDVIGIIKKIMEKGNVSENSVMEENNFCSVGNKVASASALNLKTPATVRFNKPSVTRTARKGERIVSYSANGSPVDQYDRGEVVMTAKKRRAINISGTIPFPISIGIDAGNGELIDLSDPDQRRKLDNDQKAQAIEQLMAMQEQMKNLMADW